MADKQPSKLQNYKDLQEWNEWILVNSATGRIDIHRAASLNKTLEAAIKINMELPLMYRSLKERLATKSKGKTHLQLPWFE